MPHAGNSLTDIDPPRTRSATNGAVHGKDPTKPMTKWSTRGIPDADCNDRITLFFSALLVFVGLVVVAHSIKTKRISIEYIMQSSQQEHVSNEPAAE